MALFVYGDGIQLKVGTYLTNYWSEHRLVACQWIQNEVNKQKNIVSILSGMKIFKKKSKNCKHIVRVSSFFASLAAFCCQRNYLLEILPIHCIQTLPRLFHFILRLTNLKSHVQFRYYRLQSVPTPLSFSCNFIPSIFLSKKKSVVDFAYSLYPNIADTNSF